jgi:hypothetical protein
VLGLMAFVLAVWLLRRWNLARRRRARLRALRAEFDRIAREHADCGASHVAELSNLLRRAALRYAPPSAALTGSAWLAFWDAGDPQRPFQEGAGRVLVDGPFQPRVEVDAARRLHALATDRVLRMAEQADA